MTKPQAKPKAFRIERGIAMPGRPGGRAKWPWDRMQVGDSFLCANANEAHHACGSAALFGKYHGIAFRLARRTVAGGVRVWRVA